MGCKPPQNYPWTERVLDKGYQILFLDQRGERHNLVGASLLLILVLVIGAGLSGTVTRRTFISPKDKASHLELYRADSIGEWRG